MQLSEFWKIFLKAAQYGGAAVSFVLNSILILLILFRSPPALGNYKYLMLYMVLFQLAYSMLDVIAEPTILSYGPAFFVFRNYKTSLFGREQSFYLLVVYCRGFGFCLALSAIHFIYRYGAVDKEFREKFLSGKMLYFLFLMPVVYGTLWCAVCANYFDSDGSTNLFARDILLEVYATRVEDISLLIALFYRYDKQNKPHANPTTFFAIGCLWFLIMSSTFCVFYYGIKCYRQLCRALATTRMNSMATKSLQQQLLLALVVQTLIPVILMYIPAAILYMFPMLNVNVGLPGSVASVTIAIYPAIDPLPTMFIVKDFRETLLCRFSGAERKEENGQVVDPRVKIHSIVLTLSAQHRRTTNY